MSKKFFNPISSIHQIDVYLCIASQMVLLGFYHDSSHFTSFMLEHMTTGITREYTWWRCLRG